MQSVLNLCNFVTMKNANYDKWLKRMADYCSRSEKCEFDVRTKLEKSELEFEETEELINYLTISKYIDNSRFAQFFANDKFKFNKWGKQKIRMHLKHKQIKSAYIEHSLSLIDEKQYRKHLKEALDKKIKSTKEDDKYKLREKVIRNALSKGYEMSLIIDLLKI